MTTFRTQIDAKGSQDEVFEYLATFSNAREWDPGVTEGEALTPNDVTVKEPRVISKWMFQCIVLLAMIVLSTAEIVAILLVTRSFGLRIQGGWMSGLNGGLGVLNILISKVAVDGILKRMGMSRSGKKVEVRDDKVRPQPRALVVEGGR